METFLDRLLVAIGEDNPHAFAQKCGLTDSVLRRYINGGSLPRMDTLVTIARTAGVNIDWLATGEGPMRFEGCEVKETETTYNAGKRVLPHGRRKTDLPMSKQLRRAVDGLVYLEMEDPDSFIVLTGKIVESEKKARENEDLKKQATAWIEDEQPVPGKILYFRSQLSIIYNDTNKRSQS